MTQSVKSKKRVQKFTNEQLRLAKSVDLVGYLESNGYTIKRHGRGYKVLIDGHDSDVIFPDTNTWYNFRTGEGGDIIDWLAKKENLWMDEAVNKLLGLNFVPQQNISPGNHRQKTTPKQVVELELPEKSGDYRRMFAYLVKTRKLDPELIKKCVKDGNLYQGTVKIKKGDREMIFDNCVFLGTDEKGHPRSAMLRSMNDQGYAFKGNASGTDRNYGFVLSGKPDSNWVTICESPIEALSIASLHKMRGEPWDNEHYLSLNGISDIQKSGSMAQRIIQIFLDNHPKVDTINIALNNDSLATDENGDPANHGKIAGAHIRELFHQKYTIVESYPELKDYNLELQRAVEQEQNSITDFPVAAENNNKMFTHLTETKGVSSDLVREAIADKRLYQSDRILEIDGEKRKISSTVFIEHDPAGTPLYAINVNHNTRGNKADFKIDYRNETLVHNYLSWPGNDHTLLVFNNPISMLVHQTYLQEQGKPITSHYICCIKNPAQAVEEYTRTHPEVSEVKVMLDASKAYNKHNQLIDYRELSLEKIKRLSINKGIHVVTKYPKGIDLSRDFQAIKSAALKKKNEVDLEK